MICRHCDKPIVPGQNYIALDKFSASGGGITLHEHTNCPRTPAYPPAPRRFENSGEHDTEK
ncbi:hypothetical protein [Streptomyces sp. KLOTTS4A1]|uniref:hypothetical protein n=1 Tax=Streptomyces sp. KLOTTS4A1 TaxID=3390996 RepID=UPI0039F4CFA0